MMPKVRANPILVRVRSGQRSGQKRRSSALGPGGPGNSSIFDFIKNNILIISLKNISTATRPVGAEMPGLPGPTLGLPHFLPGPAPGPIQWPRLCFAE